MPVRKISWGGGAAMFDYIISHPHIHFLFTPPAYNRNLHINGGSTMCTKGNLPCFNRVRQRQKKNFMAHDVTFSPTHINRKPNTEYIWATDALQVEPGTMCDENEWVQIMERAHT